MLPYALSRRKCGKYLLNLKFYKDLTDKGLKKITIQVMKDTLKIHQNKYIRKEFKKIQM